MRARYIELAIKKKVFWELNIFFRLTSKYHIFVLDYIVKTKKMLFLVPTF